MPGLCEDWGTKKEEANPYLWAGFLKKEERAFCLSCPFEDAKLLPKQRHQKYLQQLTVFTGLSSSLGFGLISYSPRKVQFFAQ